MTQSNLFELSHFFLLLYLLKINICFFMLFSIYLLLKHSQITTSKSNFPTPFSLFPTPYLNRHNSSDMWVWVVIYYFEVFEFEVEDIFYVWIYFQTREFARLASELQFDLLLMI